ncbi:MAG: DinB family protein [Dehalococcoidia bacterium]
MIEPVRKVVDELAGYREHFERLCRSLSHEELERMVPPDEEWTVKDYISHLATIDVSVNRWFRALAAGTPVRPSSGGERFDVDAWNQKQVEARREFDVEAILAEGAKIRAEIIETMDTFTAETLAGDIYFPGDAKRPPMDLKFHAYLRGWAKHDPMHAADMLRALPERKEEEANAWLAAVRSPGSLQEA